MFHAKEWERANIELVKFSDTHFSVTLNTLYLRLIKMNHFTFPFSINSSTGSHLFIYIRTFFVSLPPTSFTTFSSYFSFQFFFSSVKFFFFMNIIPFTADWHQPHWEIRVCVYVKNPKNIKVMTLFIYFPLRRLLLNDSIFRVWLSRSLVLALFLTCPIDFNTHFSLSLFFRLVYSFPFARFSHTRTYAYAYITFMSISFCLTI